MFLQPEITKHTKNNGTLTFKEVDINLAKKIIIENHYSKTWNSSMGKINIGVYKNNKILGVASYGSLMNPASHYKITNNGQESLIELNRLWIDDILKRNAETLLISSSIKIIKQKYPKIKHIQSFADGRLGCGTIYKASNFKYLGYSESLFYKNIETGEFYHKVLLENTKRPIPFLGLNRLFLDEKLVPCSVKTYRYIFDLYKRYPCLIKSKPYPPYEKGYTETKQRHRLGQLCRLFLFYDKIGDEIYANKSIKLLKLYGYSNNEIKEKVLEQKSRTIYQEFKKYISKNDIYKLLKYNENYNRKINDNLNIWFS